MLFIFCYPCLADGDVDRKSEGERKLSAELDIPRRPQPVPINAPSSVFYTSATNSAAVVEPSSAASLAGILDDFDWDLDTAESLQCLSEEEMKKRHSVIIEKVPCLHYMLRQSLVYIACCDSPLFALHVELVPHLH